MTLIPYEPFRRLENVRREMDRFFKETPFLQFENIGTPRIDVYETDNEVIASCEIPGIENKDDIKIEVTENSLTISGEIQKRNEINDENRIHRTERYYGNFTRTVTLPSAVKSEEAKATYKNGILEVRMPKENPPKRRYIDVDFN